MASNEAVVFQASSSPTPPSPASPAPLPDHPDMPGPSQNHPLPLIFPTLLFENRCFYWKMTLRRSKTPLSRQQKTRHRTKNTANPADFSGKTAKLYKGMPRRLKKTMTPEKLPT